MYLLRGWQFLKALFALAGLFLLPSCALLQPFNTAQPIDPSNWPDFSGAWWFMPAEFGPLGAFNFFICQNGPELMVYGADTTGNGLIRLDGSFEFLASFFIGRSQKWVIWGNRDDDQFSGYYKPEMSDSFFFVRFEGHRLGPVQRCPEGFRGEAADRSARVMRPSQTQRIDAAPPHDPSQWPGIAGKWQFSVVDPLALKGRKFSIPICQLGPELSSAFVEDSMTKGLVHLDGKFALIVRQYVGQKRSVWTLWGDLTKTEFEGYYKPWNSDAFYAVTLQGRRLGPVPQGVNCPSGFQRSP